MNENYSLEGIENYLLAATKKQTIKWTKTACEDTIRTVLKSGMVRLKNCKPVFYITVLDEKNNEIMEHWVGREGQKILSEIWDLFHNEGLLFHNLQLESIMKEVVELSGLRTYKRNYRV